MREVMEVLVQIPARRGAAQKMKPKGRVLIAEDQALIAALIEATLVDENYLVTTAYSGSDAIAALCERGSDFDVLVTDIRMEPGPDGWAVAAKARECAPEIAVIYMTGDSMAEWKAKGVADSILLAKPFVPEQVLSAVADRLVFKRWC